MKPEEIKVHIILCFVSLAINLAGLGFRIKAAVVDHATWTGVWVFGLLVVLFLFLIIGWLRLLKNLKK